MYFYISKLCIINSSNHNKILLFILKIFKIYFYILNLIIKYFCCTLNNLYNIIPITIVFKILNTKYKYRNCHLYLYFQHK